MKYITIIAWTFFLIACGGGGSGSVPSENSASGQMQGQVVKGLTQGATVTLYEVAADGSKRLVLQVLTGANGGFVLPPSSLQSGTVYLLEASGGTYRHEISGQTESLTHPLRAVFVANGTNTQFTISAVSELAVLQIENAGAGVSWSPRNIELVNANVSQAMGVQDHLSAPYIDLAVASHEQLRNAGIESTGLSMQLFAFAGFMHELKLRGIATTLEQAVDKFRQIYLLGSDDTALASAMSAGVVWMIDKSPALAVEKNRYLNAFGMPANVDVSQFSGAENSGTALEVVPNWKFRILGDDQHPGSRFDTKTLFNSRGALYAYSVGAPESDASYKVNQSASVADVYADSEVAIGRWNKGHYYSQGISYDTRSRRFNFGSYNYSSWLSKDFVYAAAEPAYDMPACGSRTLKLVASTKPAQDTNTGESYRLDPNSTIVVQYAGSAVYMRYDVGLLNSQGVRYTFASSGGLHTAGFGDLMYPNLELRTGFNSVLLPTGEQLTLATLLAGKGGTKAVISVNSRSSLTSTLNRELAAAFKQVGDVSACSVLPSGLGAFTAIPQRGGYAEILGMGDWTDQSDMTFNADGTPNFTGMVPGSLSSVGKVGNGSAGIGVLLPPYTLNGDVGTMPRIYAYAKTGWLGVNYVATGAASYRLIAATPMLLSNYQDVLSIQDVSTATLDIAFDQNPLGVNNAWYGLVTLTIPEIGVNGVTVDFSRGGASFNKYYGVHQYAGAIAGPDGRYVVVRYRNRLDDYRNSEVVLLFERN